MAGLAAILACIAVPAAAPPADSDTHGRNAEPDYARVFNQDRVNRLDIRIAASDWQTLVDDMTSLAGTRGGGLGFGGGQPGGGQPGGGQPGGGQPGGGQPGGGALFFPPESTAACTGQLEASPCSFGTPPVDGRCVQTQAPGQLACLPLGAGAVVIGGGGGGGQPPAGGGGGMAGGMRDDVELFPRTPAYVPADVTFDGETFRHVGFRLKGNSSLANTWRSGSDKLPFRLNIDGLEARYAEIRDQTFFGFTNLSFSNGALDSSYLRAKVVTDLFRDAGLPVARTAFIRVYLDRGAGPIYLGLYTMTEIPDPPMLARLFGSDDGNLYKPHGTGGRWTVFVADDFSKRSNEADEDWTDVEDAIAALQASKADRAEWRRRLEARIDVNGFLRWLAFNTIVGNFDAYGGLSAHNYYLYGSPRHRDRLFWIPWDHDLAMSGGGGLGGGAGGGAGAANVDLFHTGITAGWPLIRYLLDDPVYRAAYRAQVENILATSFEPARVSAILQSEQARIAPYVIGAEAEQPGRTFAGGPAQFDAAVFGPNGLLAYVTNRVAAVRRALAATP